MSNTRNESEDMVACVVCGNVVDLKDATPHWANIQGRHEKVFVCSGCTRLGKGKGISKYIMKESKQVGR